MATEKSPAFQFYVREWLGDAKVRAMTPEARGVYMDLLCYCWQETALTSDVAALSRLAGIPAARFRLVWPLVEPCFTLTTDGTYRHGRLDRERESQTEFREKQSGRGRKGAAERWRKHSPSIAQVMPADGSAVCNLQVLTPSKNEGVVPPPSPAPIPIHGRRNVDLMTYGPVKLWASQFRDEIVPLVATHHGGDRDAAYQPALSWVGDVDAANQATTPSTEALAKPAKWWSTQAAAKWGATASVVDDPWLKVGTK